MLLEDLARTIIPSETTLLLGAGASVASGAPSGAQLAQYLSAKLTPRPDGDDLSEISAIFENRLGRARLFEAIRDRLSKLRPTQGLLTLPQLQWRAIYTTNFDLLVEDAYQAAQSPLAVIRSNYDFGPTSAVRQQVLYKMHGCITQDVSSGSNSRLLLTESDYDDYVQYRQALFNSLRQHMLTADTVIIGQSLRDQHLRDLAKEVAALKAQGTQGRVFLLAFEFDEDRARLYRQRGIEVVGGSLDKFMHAMVSNNTNRLIRPLSDPSITSMPEPLPPILATSTRNVAHAAQLEPHPGKLFNGAPASYADIVAGFTIHRSIETSLDTMQTAGQRGFFLVLAGAAGTGKTSLARSLVLRRLSEGFKCWEHVNEYPLDVDSWLEVESALRSRNQQGVLLIDDCAPHLPSVNRLVDALGKMDRPFLRLIITVNASQWRTRTKSSYFFSRGSIERLSRLSDPDIRELVSLVDRVGAIRQLVELDFLHLGHQDRIRRLRDRCSADMFVCLKNIFASERLDDIILQEFAELEAPAQDVYRHVAALQAMGARVHRQLIMRLLGLDAGGINALLGQMDAVVDEFDVKPSMGLYGWTTRHDVIARVVATYKYANQSELQHLLESLIDHLNPTVPMELDTARSIAYHEMGISRLTEKADRVTLLQRLIAVVPGERAPRRRLVRLHLDEGDIDEADRSINNAMREIGRDDVIDRYKAILALQRSEKVPNLLPEDRFAMLLEAERLIRVCIRRHPSERYNYRVMGDIGIRMAEQHSDMRVLREAIAEMTSAEATVADPDFSQERRRLESRSRTLTRAAVDAELVISLPKSDIHTTNPPATVGDEVRQNTHR